MRGREREIKIQEKRKVSQKRRVPSMLGRISRLRQPPSVTQCHGLVSARASLECTVSTLWSIIYPLQGPRQESDSLGSILMVPEWWILKCTRCGVHLKTETISHCSGYLIQYDDAVPVSETSFTVMNGWGWIEQQYMRHRLCIVCYN